MWRLYLIAFAIIAILVWLLKESIIESITGRIVASIMIISVSGFVVQCFRKADNLFITVQYGIYAIIAVFVIRWIIRKIM